MRAAALRTPMSPSRAAALGCSHPTRTAAPTANLKRRVWSGRLAPVPAFRFWWGEGASSPALSLLLLNPRPGIGLERWLGESEQSDNWVPCLIAALMPLSRREHADVASATVQKSTSPVPQFCELSSSGACSNCQPKPRGAPGSRSPRSALTVRPVREPKTLTSW